MRSERWLVWGFTQPLPQWLFLSCQNANFSCWKKSEIVKFSPTKSSVTFLWNSKFHSKLHTCLTVMNSLSHAFSNSNRWTMKYWYLCINCLLAILKQVVSQIINILHTASLATHLWPSFWSVHWSTKTLDCCSCFHFMRSQSRRSMRLCDL